ncbi:MAG: hypothetical protein Q7R41_15690 [Phycisphaerales bacterium]|nr:hypothetical protein [Phycisphaerales bacterium]
MSVGVVVGAIPKVVARFRTRAVRMRRKTTATMVWAIGLLLGGL